MNIRFASFILVLAVSALSQADDSKFTGSIESNLTIISSNRSSQNFLVSGAAKRLMSQGRLGIDGYYNSAKQTNSNGQFETSTNQWSLGGRYEKDLKKKSFYYLSSRFEADSVNDLRLRSILGAGLGLELFAREDAGMRVSAGLSHVNEDYDGADNSYVGLQAQSEYYRNFSEKLAFTHDFLIIPNISDTKDYYFRSNAGFNYKVAANMTAGLRHIVSYTNRPAANSTKQTTTWAFVLGLKF